MSKTVLPLLTFMLVFVVGCAQPLSTREKATLGGAGLGAATGAIIGAAVGNPGAGAAIGGALGGVTGAVAGDRFQKRDTELAANQQQIERQRQEIVRNRQLLEELKRRNLEARETERGVVVNLPDVLFEFGRSDLTGDAQSRVQGIADVLNDQAQGRRVSIEGHTDAIGSEEANQLLSERRADSVAGALTTSGVDQARVTTTGYGERYPVAPNTNPDGSDNSAGRAKNRRVEVVIEN
jgi:outer membrane protein OmpA-like peptidoglycan-associated protein